MICVDAGAKDYIARVRERVLNTVKTKHTGYYKSYLSERRLDPDGLTCDPIDLVLYVCNRL
jgi:hypothetical protein